MYPLFKAKRIKALVAGTALLASGGAFALPALQLGPGDGADDSWFYGDPPGCVTPDTWCASSGDGTLQLAAYALLSAWDTAGQTNRYAYLVATALPQGSGGPAPGSDQFNISVSNSTAKSSGYGKPPPNDPLGGHSVWDSWYEIFEFRFDGSAENICNTEPGNEADCASGYKELFNITLNGFAEGLTGIHFDLFTVKDDGLWVVGSGSPGGPQDLNDVKSSAPFSHDAEWGGGDGGDGGGPNCEPPFCVEVPEPGMTALMGTGLVALGFIGWRRRKQAGNANYL